MIFAKTPLAVVAAVAAFAAPCAAQTVAPFYAGTYTFSDLGSITDVPPSYGGLTLKYDNPFVLLIGGGANGSLGAIYAVQLTRDSANHITGFAGPATLFAEAAYNDGGVAYGPGNVLFLARWPVNQLGQTKPGSVLTDRIIDMAPFGVESSVSSINFVPQGFPGAGRMKLTTYSGGQWSDVTIAPDGAGTFDVTAVTEVPASRLPGAPEGFAFVPLGSPLFVNPSMVVSEYGAGTVAAYELDASGNPVIGTRRDFITGLSGVEGAFIDPFTGDFLFSTFGGGNRVIVVRGFFPPPQCYANCDGTLVAPYLNVNDFICFQTKFSQGDPYANCDGSTVPPVLNVNDFICFINAYAQGCF